MPPRIPRPHSIRGQCVYLGFSKRIVYYITVRWSALKLGRYAISVWLRSSPWLIQRMYFEWTTYIQLYDNNNDLQLQQSRQRQSCLIAPEFSAAQENSLGESTWCHVSSLEEPSRNGNASGTSSAQCGSAMCIARSKFKVNHNLAFFQQFSSCVYIPCAISVSIISICVLCVCISFLFQCFMFDCFMCLCICVSMWIFLLNKILLCCLCWILSEINFHFVHL